MDRLHFEDFPVGGVLMSRAYEVTREEIVAFAREYDPQDYHLDEAAAQRSLLGSLSASGWHTCAIAMRLMCDSYLSRTASMGSPGLDNVRWLRPVRPGDVLTLRSTCREARMSKSRPGMGICSFLWELLGADGEPVCTITGLQLIQARAAAPGAAGG